MAYRIDYDEFVTLVAEDLDVDIEEAERAIQATLLTLGERIDRDEARDLAAELPEELAPWVATDTEAERFNVDEFLRRVAEREGVDEGTAERHTRAVFAALGQTVSRRQLDDLVAQLPKDYAPLLPAGPDLDVRPVRFLTRRVADEAGIRPEQARRALDAVLETLAERIAAGEVEDLAARLPVELHPALRRGEERSGGKARQMSLDEFLTLVADRAGVTTDIARDEVRAVFTVLREAVGDDEFFDVVSQLPGEYDPVLATR